MSRKPHCYVYLHRDESDRVVYVGKGTGPRLLRSQLDHEGTRWVSGPYTSSVALKVEAAIISALSARCGWNENAGGAVVTARLNNKVHSDGPRFQPLGISEERARRYPEGELTLKDLSRRAGGPALVVLLTSAKFKGDDREAPDLIRGNAPRALAERAQKWWYLRRLVALCTEARAMPRVIVAAYGTSGSRVILGSWRTDIRPSRWREDPKEKGGLYVVPLADPAHHDYLQLVGRRVSGLWFGQGSSAFCVVWKGRAFGAHRRLDSIDAFGRSVKRS